MIVFTEGKVGRRRQRVNSGQYGGEVAQINNKIVDIPCQINIYMLKYIRNRRLIRYRFNRPISDKMRKGKDMLIAAFIISKTALFFIEMIILFAGVFVIAIVTPKLAAFIDKQRAKNKSPYESAPLPERVDDDISADNGTDKNQE